MKSLSYMIVLILLVTSLGGCHPQTTATGGSVSDILNEAFLQSELSEYAGEDSLFFVDFIGSDKNKITARDIEEFGTFDSGYFAIIPRYTASSILVEWMILDDFDDFFPKK